MAETGNVLKTTWPAFTHGRPLTGLVVVKSVLRPVPATFVIYRRGRKSQEVGEEREFISDAGTIGVALTGATPENSACSDALQNQEWTISPDFPNRHGGLVAKASAS